MNYNKYTHHISFLTKEGEKEPEDPAKNNSDEVIEIEKEGEKGPEDV